MGDSLGDQIKIDEIDAKILTMLLAESRTSFTDIANECNTTVTSIRMHYKRLWKYGVVNGEQMLVNPQCLGYHHIVDLGITTTVENEKEVAKFLEGKPYISEMVSPAAKYNFLGKVALKDLNTLGEIIEDLESNSNIKHVDALIWAQAVNIEYPQNLIIRPLDSSDERKNSQMPALTNNYQASVEIDETDREIAKILSRESRTPFLKIAEQLKISTKTVIRRYSKLRENLLPFSTIAVNLNKLGYRSLANIYIKVSKRSKMSEVCSQLLQIPNLIVVIRYIGPYDLYSAIALEDFDRMFEAHDKIRAINGIETADVFLTRMVPSWPLNLFPSLLENETLKPKYWAVEPKE